MAGRKNMFTRIQKRRASALARLRRMLVSGVTLVHKKPISKTYVEGQIAILTAKLGGAL